MAENEQNSTRYKLVTYETARGPRAGVVLNDAVFDTAELTGKASHGTMLGALEDWAAAEALIDEAVSKLGSSAKPSSPLAKVRLLAPVLYPSAIFCAGANYSDHMSEMARVFNLGAQPDPREAGLAPWHFLKASRTVAHAGRQHPHACRHQNA